MLRHCLPHLPALLALGALAPLTAQQPERSLTPPPVLRPADGEPIKTAVPLHFQTVNPLVPVFDATAPAPAPAAGNPIAGNPVEPPRDLVILDQPHTGGPVWFLGNGFKGSVGDDGFQFLPFLGADADQHHPVELRLQQVTVGGSAVNLDKPVLSFADRRIELRRRGVVEYYDVATDHVEQSFRFDTLPARGELRLQMVLATGLRPEVLPDGLRFRHALGHVDYTDGVAFDAKGERCPVAIQLDGNVLCLTVPAAFVEQAALPLVVDPRVVANTIAQAGANMWEPDIAWNQTSNEYLAVWVQPYNQTDYDVWARRMDVNMNTIGNAFTIDFTSSRWEHARVACRPSTDNFLVVAQVSTANTAPFWIGGRIANGSASSGTLFPPFDIERSGVIGLSGNNYRPDVGGDSYPGTYSVHYAVVWEHETSPGGRDIHLKTVNNLGTVVPTMPVVVSSRFRDEANPSISNYNGESNSSIPLWAVVWQETYSATDTDIMVATVSLSGSVMSGPSYLNGSLANDVNPRVSSYTDRLGGGRYFMAVYEHNPDIFSNSGRVYGTVFSPSAGALVTADLNALDGSPVTRAQWWPAVDSDRCRFAVTYTELTPGVNNFDVRASTFAFNPAGNTLVAHDPRAAIATINEPQMVSSIVSNASAGMTRTVRYGIVNQREYVAPPLAYPRGIEAVAYDGCAPGNAFNWRSAGCGNLQLAYLVTPPALGTRIGLGLLGAGPVSGFLVGFPMPAVPLGPCTNCSIGVANSVTAPPAYSLLVPCNMSFVGMTLSAQGWSVTQNGPCLGVFALSGVLDITIQ